MYVIYRGSTKDYGTGFFGYLKLSKNESFYALVTNYHVLNDKKSTEESSIEIETGGRSVIIPLRGLLKEEPYRYYSERNMVCKSAVYKDNLISYLILLRIIMPVAIQFHLH